MTECAKDAVSWLGPGHYRSSSVEATQLLGELLGDQLREGDVVILSGDLGAGKTCLTGGVARALGDERPVTSPTFTIMCVHDRGRLALYHFDLYRLEDASELDDVGIYDVLDADGACLIEWGERFADELGDDSLNLTLTREESGGTGEPARVLRAEAVGGRGLELLGRFDDAVRRACEA